MRPLVILLAGVALLGAVFWGASRLGGRAMPPGLVLKQVSWGALAGWAGDDQRPAFEAFQRSCKKIEALQPFANMGGDAIYGKASDWQTVCLSAASVTPATPADTRAWFEQNFAPFEVRGGKSLFTGYYEPELEGSLAKSEVYATPLLKTPGDLVSVDLGEFREGLKGQRIAGRVVGAKLKPYDTRAQITGGSLDADALAIAWVRDPIDAFFLQIQGSGRIRLPDGGVVRVGYDGQNGQPYTPIGRVLRQMGALDPKTISMRTIRAWLQAHPDDADMVMDQNASYVFFRKLEVADPSLGPLGADGTNLTPGRSLAVDRVFHALGVPMWLDTSLPLDEAGTPGQVFRRLMIAQDTGGAIVGTVRGDVFFGSGAEAETLAGRMKQHGKLYVLLPKSLAANLK